MKSRILLALCLTTAATSASAQDVIVMRRVVAPPSVQDLPVRWSEGDWTFTDDATCTSSAPQRRDVTCLRDGRQVSDAACSGLGAKPATERQIERTDSCTYRWDDARPFGAWTNNATCSDTAQRTRAVACLRSDGTTEPNTSLCTGAKPTASETGVFTGCSYRWDAPSGWGAYAEVCSDSTYHTRTITCQRDGDGATKTVNDSFCSNAGPKGSEREDGLSNYSGCTFVWGTRTSVCDGNGSRDVTFQCERYGGSTTRIVVTTPGEIANCGTMPATHVADSSCGTPSLLTNGGFEDGLSPWTATGQGKVVTASEQAFNGTVASGAKAFQFITGSSASQSITNLVEGRTYTATFKVAASSDFFSVYLTGPSSSRRIFNYRLGSTWTEYSVDFTVAYTDKAIRFESSNLAYLDSVTIKQK